MKSHHLIYDILATDIARNFGEEIYLDTYGINQNIFRIVEDFSDETSYIRMSRGIECYKALRVYTGHSDVKHMILWL
jgi:hypothetical protein